jgi:uncharacterized protein (TIGR00369 family)
VLTKAVTRRDYQLLPETAGRLVNDCDNHMTATIMDGFAMPPCAKLLGWRMIEADPARGYVKIGFEGRPEFCNPAGYIQGGLLSAMLDDTMGPAVLLHTDGAAYTATISLTVNFLAPARVGSLIGEANVVQVGRTVAFVEAKLTDADSVVVATATSTARVVQTAKAVAQGAMRADART